MQRLCIVLYYAVSDFVIRESHGVNIIIGFAHFIQPNVNDIVMETHFLGLCQTLTQYQ